MSTYTKSKKIAKILIWTGLSAVLFSGILFLFMKLQTSADDTGEESGYNSNLYVVSEGATTTIYISGKDYGSATDITKQEDQCPTRSNPCYSVSSATTWDNPSIFVNSNRPAWTFLNDAINQAPYGMPGDSDRVANVVTAYITEAFSKWGALTLNGNEFTIKSPELINALNENHIPLTNLPSDEITVDQTNSVVKVEMAETYPHATRDSAWVKSTDFILGSALEPWEEAATTFNFRFVKIEEFRQKIEHYRDIYENSIRLREQANTSGNIISLQYPSYINLENLADATDFSLKLDKTKFSLPAGTDYKIKVFLKPYDKKDAVYSNWFPATRMSESGNIRTYTFSWHDFASRVYSDANNVTIPTSVTNLTSYYDMNFPQKYFLRVNLVDTDGTTTKETLTNEFSTINPSWASVSPAVANSTVLGISAQPKGAGKGTTITTTITVNKPAATAPTIEKVVLYACKGNANSVIGSESETCTLRNSAGEIEDAVKGSWAGIDFGSSNTATLKGSWTINDGTSIGEHALMVKAYAPDGTYGANDGNPDYITPDDFVGEKSKTAVDVNVTNSVISTSGSSSTDIHFTGLFAGLFKTKASSLPRGSSIVSFGQLFKTIVKYSSGLIGIIAVFVIIIAGFLYMTAGGNEAQTTKAKKAIIYSLLGIAIYVLAYGIMYNVIHIITSITGGSSGGAMTPISLASLIIKAKTELTLDDALTAALTLTDILTSFAAAVGFIMIIWSSILYVTSVGDENKAETAKKTLIWSIAGTLIVTFAGFLVGLVDRFLA